VFATPLADGYGEAKDEGGMQVPMSTVRPFAHGRELALGAERVPPAAAARPARQGAYRAAARVRTRPELKRRP
jgi:hypothetical protein